MRFIPILLTSLLLFACALPPAVPTSEEGRQAEAEQLVRYSLTGRVTANAEEGYVELFRDYLVSRQVPAEQAEALVREEFAALVADGGEQRLLDALVPVYRRYYTAAEIHQLLSFYQTDVARKSLEVGSRIAAEAEEPLRSWNEHYVYLLLDRLEARVAEMGLRLDQ